MKLLLSVCLILSSTFGFAQKGTIFGKVADGKTGETLIGVSVVVEGSNPLQGTVSDFDGNFVLENVAVGTQKITLKYVGYATKTLAVNVTAGAVATVNTVMETGNTEIKEVVIEAKASRVTQSAIFAMQKNSTIIQSGISSEDMKRSPDRSSSEVLRRVSGATIQDGKFAIIRGLSDRYNMALLNNTILPATEPDRKAFAFDIFPSNILDNIIIMKTAQADLPSEWAGGLIQLNTRDIPEKSFLNFTIGQTFVEQTTFKHYNTYQGSKTDFLGVDNGTRTLSRSFPSILDFNNKTTAAQRQALGADLLKAPWGMKQSNSLAYPIQSLQLSGGYVWRKKKDVQLGIVGALSYSNGIRYTTGTRAQPGWSDYHDVTYNNSVTTALLGNISLQIKNRHRISWKNNYTINSDNNTILRSGLDLNQDKDVKRYNLEFISAKVFSTNLSGEHILGAKEFKLRWNGGLVLMNRDQPRNVRYAYERAFDQSGYFLNLPTTGADPKYATMFYSRLQDRIVNGGVDFSAPFKINERKQTLKVGVYYQNRSRDFEARYLFIRKAADSLFTNVTGSIDEVVNRQNMQDGKLELAQVTNPNDIYHATSNTYAAYAMLENNITNWLKAVWGFRFEYFTQRLQTANSYTVDYVRDGEGNLVKDVNGNYVKEGRFVDTAYTKNYFSGAYKAKTEGKIAPVFPILPSVNLIFKLNENMNVRASYSQSMSRPEFREIAPFLYYDFMNDYELMGNENLLQTFIHNADLRYEWFMGNGQVLNASVFYKHFTNTIELAARSSASTNLFQYTNGGHANLAGVELETRKNFGFINKKLEDLVFTANLAYIYSMVDMSNVKNSPIDEIRRPMQGQSPYIINLGLSYLNKKIGFGANILYNQTGDRLYASGIIGGGNPTWYEHWRPLLDMQISQVVWKDHLTIRLTLSDLLAKPTIFYQNGIGTGSKREYEPGKDFIARQVNNYRSYYLQFAFTF